jgi:hypothetical protein
MIIARADAALNGENVKIPNEDITGTFVIIPISRSFCG